jgi:hypothetical protein
VVASHLAAGTTRRVVATGQLLLDHTQSSRHRKRGSRTDRIQTSRTTASTSTGPRMYWAPGRPRGVRAVTAVVTALTVLQPWADATARFPASGSNSTSTPPSSTAGLLLPQEHLPGQEPCDHRVQSFLTCSRRPLRGRSASCPLSQPRSRGACGWRRSPRDDWDEAGRTHPGSAVQKSALAGRAGLRDGREGAHVASVGGLTASRRPPEGLSRRVKGRPSDGGSAGHRVPP